MSVGLLLIDIQNDYFPGGKMELQGSAEAAQVAEYFLTIAPSRAKERTELAGLEKALADAKPETTVPIMRDRVSGGCANECKNGDFFAGWWGVIALLSAYAGQ